MGRPRKNPEMTTNEVESTGTVMAPVPAANAGEISRMNIFEKMAAIAAEMPNVSKSLEVTDGKRSYTAVSEADVLLAVKPLEAKYRIYSYPSGRKPSFEKVHREYLSNGVVRNMELWMCTVETQYTFVDLDNPDGERITVTSIGSGIDSGDKAPGKAMTYCDKYALMKAYKMFSGDASDPDSVASPPLYGYEPMENNPMVFEDAAATSIQNEVTPVEREPDAEETPAPEKKTMTLAEAKAVIVTFGKYAGKSFGEMETLDKSSVDFYAEKFNNPKYPLYKEAATIIRNSR